MLRTIAPTNVINATTITATTSVTTPIVQALNSAGGTLKNSGGTNQLQWGLGGGNNLSLEVATNINPANAAVAISPTGTGTVTINPATASTMNNVAIGGTTALTGRFTNVTLTTGNLIVSSGQGIDFSATPGTGTSELLADYEEGNWTPTGNGITFTSSSGKYTKIGNLVVCEFICTFPTTSSAANAQINGLPFTTTTSSGAALAGYTSGINGILINAENFIRFANVTNTAYILNSGLSTQTVQGSIAYTS
jgi:hypothetical protein